MKMARYEEAKVSQDEEGSLLSIAVRGFGR
jgi:hypothetical protein